MDMLIKSQTQHCTPNINKTNKKQTSHGLLSSNQTFRSTREHGFDRKKEKTIENHNHPTNPHAIVRKEIFF